MSPMKKTAKKSAGKTCSKCGKTAAQAKGCKGAGCPMKKMMMRHEKMEKGDKY